MTQAIPVPVFREIMLLPLRFRAREDAKEWEHRFGDMLPEREWQQRKKDLSFLASDEDIWCNHMRHTNEHQSGASRDEYERTMAYGEKAYFHPYIQEFLYGEFGPAGEAMESWNRKGIDRLRVKMGYGGGPASAFTVDLKVERIELHHIKEPGLAMGLVEVSANAATPVFHDVETVTGADGTSTLRAKTGGKLKKHPFTLIEVMLLRDALRRVFPHFFTGPEARTDSKYQPWARTQFPIAVIPLDTTGREVVRAASIWGPRTRSNAIDQREALKQVSMLVDDNELPVAPWWRVIFGDLTMLRGRSGRLRFQQVVDERMPTVSFLALPMGTQLSRGDYIRLCFADGPDGKPVTGLPYDETFMVGFEQEHCYDRYLGSGTRMMASPFTFVMVAKAGYGTGPLRDMTHETSYEDVSRVWADYCKSCLTAKDSDFALDILQEHLRRHYTRMVMLAHIEKAGQLTFSNWISRTMAGAQTLRDPAYRKQMDDLRRAYAEFSQSASFSNVTNQEQGRELYALVMKHLRGGPLSTEISAEFDRARAILTEIDTERQAISGTFLATIAAVFAVFAVAIGVPPSKDAVQGSLGGSLQALVAMLRGYAPWFAMAGALSFLVGVLQVPRSKFPLRIALRLMFTPGIGISIATGILFMLTAIVLPFL